MAAGYLDSSSLSSQAAWQGVALLALVLDAGEKLAFVSFETGRTTALASARQNGCIPALLLLKSACSLQRAARRTADARGQPLCPAVARETAIDAT